MDTDKIGLAMQIYYLLLKEGKLTLETSSELFNAYSDPLVKDVLNVMSQESEVVIERYNRTIYLIPKENNDFLGIKFEHLAKVIHYKHTKINSYTVQYLIIMLIMEFFSGKGVSIQSREFISINEFVENVTKRFEAAKVNKDQSELDSEARFNMTRICEHWLMLKTDDPKSTGFTSKNGYIRIVSRFLEKHDLVHFYEIEEQIRPTTKFVDLVKYNFLNNDRQELIEKIFEKSSEYSKYWEDLEDA